MERSEMELKTVPELRAMCLRYGIPGMSKARKDDIIDALENYFEDQNEYSDDGGDQNTTQTSDGIPLVAVNAELSSYVNVNANASGDGRYLTNITVSCGASSGNFPVVGKTVGQVAEFLREALNIDRLSIGVVNGVEVKDEYVLVNGDSLEFLKTSGRKG